jgi:hypothetical protein
VVPDFCAAKLNQVLFFEALHLALEPLHLSLFGPLRRQYLGRARGKVLGAARAQLPGAHAQLGRHLHNWLAALKHAFDRLRFELCREPAPCPPLCHSRSPGVRRFLIEPP